MAKNWISFIVVCVGVWLWLVIDGHNRSERFEREKKEWQERDRAYREFRAQEARIEEERRAEAAAAIARLEEQARAIAAGVTPPRTPAAEEAADPTTTLAPPIPVLSPDSPELAEIRTLQARLFNPLTAPQHIVETDLVRVVFSELGGVPVSWEIKSSPFVTNLGDPSDPTSITSVELIRQGGDSETRDFPLMFVGSTARDFNNLLFDTEIIHGDGEKRILFTAKAPGETDMVVRREFTFRNDSFVVDFRASFENGQTSRKALGGRQGFGIGWQGGFGQPEIMTRATGRTQIVWAQDERIRNRSIERNAAVFEVQSREENNRRIDWAGQEKKYFVAILIPSALNPVDTVRASVERRNDDAGLQRLNLPAPINVELIHPPAALDVGESAFLEYQLFVGPKNREALSDRNFIIASGTVSPDRLVFHTLPLGMGFLRPLALALLYLMRMLFDFLGMWGLAIIGTTIIVRIAIYPLTHWAIKNQARTMVEQQKIRPEMEEIQKKYKTDPMKRNQAIMQLYRDHNVNPLGFLRGCLPILLQMPIFLALYVVFEQSVELRGQAFAWIPDLSGEDQLFTWGLNIPILGPHFNLLPVLMGTTAYLQMKIMQMPATDELQARIQKQMMIMMPILFVFFLYRLPSGLILYWTVSNTISIGQSYLTKRMIAKHMKEHEAEQAKAAAAKPEERKKGMEKQGTAEA